MRQFLHKPGSWRLAFAAWFGLLWYLSSQSHVGGGPEIPHLDKVAHFIYFSAGGFLTAGILCSKSPALRAKHAALIAIPVVAVIGAIDEIHQLYTPHRSGADVFDWMADILGASFGTWFFMKARNLLLPSVAVP